MKSISNEVSKKNKKTESYYVYLLLCKGGSFYTGYTNNLDLRFKRHKKGCGARYTKMHRPKRVVYFEKFKTRGAAIKREQEIKTLSHSEKSHLISIDSSA